MTRFSFDSFYAFYEKQSSVSETKHGYHFNVLAEQCGNIVENSHTNLLMQLLEYRNKYGYVFLESFVSLAGFDISIEDRDVQFKREFVLTDSYIRKGILPLSLKTRLTMLAIRRSKSKSILIVS